MAKNYRANQDDRTKHNVPIRSSSRAYDNERNDLYDLRVSARYRLFDWGVGQSLVRGETNELHAERLSYEMQLALSQDMLRLLMQIESGKQDIAIRQASLREVVSHQEAVEAQGQAGTLGLARVRAEGAVIPPSDIQIVQSRLPGSITEIHVQLGSEVKKGDVLFRIEDDEVQADYAENEVIIASREAALLRLQAEIDEAKEISFPRWLQDAAPEAVAKEANLFQQRAIALQEQISVILQSIEELDRTIIEKTAEGDISLQQYRIRKQEYDLLKPLVEAGHESRLVLIEAETKWRQAQGAAELATLSVAAMQAKRRGLLQEIVAVKKVQGVLNHLRN